MYTHIHTYTVCVCVCVWCAVWDTTDPAPFLTSSKRYTMDSTHLYIDVISGLGHGRSCYSLSYLLSNGAPLIVHAFIYMSGLGHDRSCYFPKPKTAHYGQYTLVYTQGVWDTTDPVPFLTPRQHTMDSTHLYIHDERFGTQPIMFLFQFLANSSKWTPAE